MDDADRVNRTLKRMPKLCKDCKHGQPFTQRILLWKVTDWSLAKCKVVGCNLSDGEPKRFCDIERDYGDQCGKDGKLWEPAH